MPINFKITITEEYMYDFLLRHFYSHTGGIFSTIAGIASGLVGIFFISKLDFTQAGVWVMTAFILLYVNRQTLKTKAKIQVKKSDMINKSVYCEMKEEGVLISRGGDTATTPWDEFTKVVTTKKSIILYLGRVRAFIFPKEQIGEQKQAVVEMIQKHIPKNKIRGLK